MVREFERSGAAEPAALGCPVLVTERLVLRPPHPDDAAELAQLADDRRVALMLARMPHPYGESDAKHFIETCRERGGAIYAVTLADTGAFVGCAGLDVLSGGPAAALELGYWIGEPFWNRGFATEAAHALVDLAFRASGVDALRASCRVLNPASRRVLQKCGFQYAGQGMMDSAAAGRVAVERYVLDRRTWVALRSWPRA